MARDVVYALRALRRAPLTALTIVAAVGLVAEAVHVFDPLAYLSSALCIVAACLLAASIPALRAARIDPMITLRRE